MRVWERNSAGPSLQSRYHVIFLTLVGLFQFIPYPRYPLSQGSNLHIYLLHRRLQSPFSAPNHCTQRTAASFLIYNQHEHHPVYIWVHRSYLPSLAIVNTGNHLDILCEISVAVWTGLVGSQNCVFMSRTCNSGQPSHHRTRIISERFSLFKLYALLIWKIGHLFVWDCSHFRRHRWRESFNKR